MAKIGYTMCGMCGNKEATVNETATGTLSTGCHVCDFSGFAKKGTKAERMIRRYITPIDDDQGDDLGKTPIAEKPIDPQSKGASPEVKPPKKPTSVFNLGSV